jgi:predicted permease
VPVRVRPSAPAVLTCNFFDRIPFLLISGRNSIKLVMHIFIVVLQSVLVLLGIGVIGFWITRRGIVPENVLSFLSRLAIDIALPCMVFSSMVSTFTPDKMPDWWQLPLWWAGFAVFSLALTLLTMFFSNRDIRGEFAMSLFFQNGLFFPLIIISGVFGTGSAYIPQLYIFIMLHPVMFFSTYHLFFRKKALATKISWNRIFNPILIATVVAVTAQLFHTGEYLPSFVSDIFRILGGMALPLIMIILGGSLYLDFKQRGKIYVKEILKFLAIKNVVFPLACMGLLVIIKPNYNIALLLFLQAAVPPVTSNPILAERGGGNKAITNQFVFSSFIFSVVSIPLVFLAFNHYFAMP